MCVCGSQSPNLSNGNQARDEHRWERGDRKVEKSEPGQQARGAEVRQNENEDCMFNGSDGAKPLLQQITGHTHAVLLS